MDFMKNLRSNVKKIRESKHMTQEGLAEASSMSPRSVINLENNDKTTPMISSVIKVAEALNVHPSCFFFERIPDGGIDLFPFHPVLQTSLKLFTYKVGNYSFKYIAEDPEAYRDMAEGGDYIYRLAKDYIYSPFYGFMTRFCIGICHKEVNPDSPFFSVIDLDCDEELISELVRNLNEGQTPPMHIFDMLEDFMITLYSRFHFYS